MKTEQITKSEARGMAVDFTFTGLKIKRNIAAGYMTWMAEAEDKKFPYTLGGQFSATDQAPWPHNGDMEELLLLIDKSKVIVKWSK